MTRALWAFVWLRWRTVVNSLKSAQRRDAVERVSRVAALIIPALFVASSISAVSTAVAVGAYAGWSSAAHPVNAIGILTAVRVLLLIATIFAMLMPLFVGMHGGAGIATRILLLPISRRMLHGVEVLSSLADPWIVFVVPAMLAYAGGVLWGGLFAAEPYVRHFVGVGAIALAAGVGEALVLASLASTVGFLVSWLVRDRRRGEWFVLIFVVVLSGASLVPALISKGLEDQAGGSTAWVMSDLPAWTQALPSELYGAAVGNAVDFFEKSPWPPLVALFAEGAFFYLVSSLVHRRIVESVEMGRSRRSRNDVVSRLTRIPGMWPGTAAVAVAQVRTALRSVRGRLVVLLPGPIVTMIGIAFGRIHASGTTESLIEAKGFVAFGAGLIFALYAAQAFTMNQFGSDRSGLTRQFLAPIRDVDLVRGKAVGCAVLVAMGGLISLACALASAPGGSTWSWLATALGGAAATFLLSPISAIVSIYFPVASDLSKTGTGGNPHGLAMLVGTVLVACAAAPAAAAVLLLRPLTALGIMAIWCALAAVIAQPLLTWVSSALHTRRENLALVAQGR